MALTKRQFDFAIAVASGASNREAYEQAGYCTSGMSEAAISVEASRLKHNDGVSRIIAGVEEQVQQKAVWNRIEAMERLEKVNSRCLDAIEGERFDPRAIRGFMESLRELNTLANVEAETVENREERFGAQKRDADGFTLFGDW